jgi:dTDP-4-amino-4,6-dideoxygalactose transaminase
VLELPVHQDLGPADVGISPLSRFLALRADFPEIVRRRRANYERLAALLGDVAPPATGALRPGVCPLFYPLRCVDKDRVRASLAREGIEAVDFWRTGSPLARGAFPEAEELRRQVLELPVHQDLGPADVAALADAVRRALRAER